MGVADADRVRIAEGDASRLGRGPGADARDRQQPRASLLGRKAPSTTRSALAVPADASEQLRSTPLEPERDAARSRGEKPGPRVPAAGRSPAGTRRPLAQTANDRHVGVVGLRRGHLLLDDGRDQGRQQLPGARQPQARRIGAPVRGRAGWRGTSGLGSSSSPASPGTASRACSAPGPQASATTASGSTERLQGRRARGRELAPARRAAASKPDRRVVRGRGAAAPGSAPGRAGIESAKRARRSPARPRGAAAALRLRCPTGSSGTGRTRAA